ncbi:hypothetical protein BD626DRAFT_396566 [Schizophyllum amplum]|uniref:Zn(2)-C6 fungal-type domain-containing protein n=1 Tax=Schizophyllum amplum TaxID=97359 RepID=A0A550CQF2_9AGAR|nr:hypothetical protein BD626DRAFT_396566 [Auriculariopsis ampla]
MRRGEIACAECRRLKVKCDRTIPCSTCVKRGCAALCPNGTIPPGEGSRFVLAATDHLETRRATMEARMHALEDALAILHSTQSDHTHPLLQEAFEDDAFEPSPEDIAAEQEATGTPRIEEAQQPTRSVGALHMDELGSSRFYGPSGGSEVRNLNVPCTRTAPQELDPSYLGPEINNAYNAFPFVPAGMAVPPVQSAIESFLPSIERAVTLVDTMLEHLSWMFRIVSRAEIMNDVLPAVYKQSSRSYSLHELALLLSVLALGALVDLNQAPYNLEAQHYYHLTRAAITLQPVLTDQSMATAKTLHLMSIYNGMSGQERALETTYNLLSLAGQAALRCADIDPSMWQFTGQEAYERRAYFWNLLSAVMWQSLVTGRPPVILSTFIDCRIPTSEEEDLYQEGEVPVGFGVWGYRASVACLVPLVLTTLCTNTPPYDKILEVDKQIRDFFSVARESSSQNERTAATMRNFVRSHYEDLMMLFLHRGCFAEAMMYPNPLRSPYAPSVQAAYKSACMVLADTQEHYLKNPLLLTRVWRVWSNAFSAAVVVGTVARKGIHMAGMPDPFEKLESAVELFREASTSSSRAERGLVSLLSQYSRTRESLG